MTEIPKTFSRKARLEDFFEKNDNKNIQEILNKSNTNNDTNIIPKNQQEFGHKKRIKP